MRRFLENVASEKQIEFSSMPGIEVALDQESSSEAFTKVNPIDLKTILSNVINNAVESYPESRGRVSLSYKMDENECVAIVTDSGSGIAPHLLKQLGKSNVTFNKKDGRGLGLVHAQRTVLAWGGRLEIASIEGQGTSISIVLPRAIVPRQFEAVQ